MSRVRDVMTPNPLAAEVPGTRRELLKLFGKHAFAGFPVVKQGSRKLVGLVTHAEVLANPDEDQLALLMNPNPFTTYPEAHVREAARIVHENRVRTLPVVSGSNDLVGVVTPSDLLRTLRRHTGRISAHLHRRHVPCHRSTPANVAFEILRSTGARALPVLDDAGRLAGLITDGGVLARAQVTDTVVRTVAGMGADSDDWAWEGLRDLRLLEHASTRVEVPGTPVGEIMVRDVRTAIPTATVGDAASRMLEHGISQLPVVDDEGRLVDLLVDTDLVSALL